MRPDKNPALINNPISYEKPTQSYWLDLEAYYIIQ